MDNPVTTPAAQTARPLPCVRYDAHGGRHVDYRGVIALATPLFLNSSLQALLNLTDTWFVGHISTDAVAAVGSVYWFTVVCIFVLGGVGLAVQTLVAQAYGAGDRTRATRKAWMGFWGAWLTAPLFLAVALCGQWVVAPFGLAPPVAQLAEQFWFPRLLGGPAGVALWALTSFFNGISRTGVTLLVMGWVTVANALFNAIFIFGLGLGVAGAAWATAAAQVCGVAVALALFLSAPMRREFHSHRQWRPHAREIGAVVALGVPMGLPVAVDLMGIALFQAMQSTLDAVSGAATQIVMMLTSIAYMPTVGIALAGTTLVGQSIGAGDKAWAARVGNAAIKLAVGYMAGVGIFLAVAGPWLMPLFIASSDPMAHEVATLGRTLLWFAAGYQIFDGLNLGSAFCLRGAADVRVPALLLIALSWFGFVPFSHMLIFAPGEGWVSFLPQFGWGAAGGWLVALLYTIVIGTVLFLRWRSGAWRGITLR